MSHSTCGADNDGAEADEDECAPCEDDEEAPEDIGDSGDGPDAWVLLGDWEPRGGPDGRPLGTPALGEAGADGRSERDGDGCAGADAPPRPPDPPCPAPAPGWGPDGLAGCSGSAGAAGDDEGCAPADGPPPSSRPAAGSPPAGRPGPCPVRRDPLPRPSAASPPGLGLAPFASPCRAALPDGFGWPGSLTLMQPASEAASAETATAAAATRASGRPDCGAERAAGRPTRSAAGRDGSNGGRAGIGRTAGPPDPGRRDGGDGRPAQLPPPA
ncbi:hypothetical protein [Streptomyces sp. CT34]|uniref:hypothetical protein n=1 Tax=Streptomyces sp. CT34 TaxID=1553907 RepID=UPI0005B90BF8|nr:hypothetical protein [Streptomyces sp. CT34]